MAGAAARAAQGLAAGQELRLPAPNSAGAIGLLQVLHLRPSRPLGEAVATRPRPVWRCGCGGPMSVLRRRMPAEQANGHPVVHDKPDKAGPTAGHSTH